MIVGEGILQEGGLEGRQIEALGDGPRLVGRQLEQAGRQSAASSSANAVRPAALRGPSWASAGGRITSA